MRKIQRFVCFFVCLSSLVIFGEAEAWAQGFVPYSNPGGRYTIMHPANWQLRMISGISAFVSPQESPADMFRENVNVVYETLPSPMNTTQYAFANLQTMAAGMTNFVIVEQGPTVLANQPAYYTVYQHFMGQNLKVLVFFLVRGNIGYSITCSASPAQFTRYRPLFQQIANTIRFP